MPTTPACLKLTADTPDAAARARAWPIGPIGLGDLICVDEAAGDLGPRIHTRFGIIILPAPAVLRVERSRSVVADRNWALLTPPSHLHAVRVEGRAPGALTLLLRPAQRKDLAMPDRPALVPDAALGAEVAALVARWRRPLRALESVVATRSVLQRLLARSTPLRPSRRATALLPIRDYLQAHPDGPVPTEALAAMCGLTEGHLIRAFHTEFGLPPQAYHLRVRLAAASDLLAQGLAVSTAVYECGFADQSHLTRKFKEAYGLTPAAWATASADPRQQSDLPRRATWTPATGR